MTITASIVRQPRCATAARGLTLVELVIAIVIISIAVTGVLLAFTQMVARSADPMIDVQASAIAEAYMDEILARPVCGGPAGGTRDNFACVENYYGLSQAPRNQLNHVIPELAAYTVAVAVAAGSGGSMGIAGAANIAPVQVTVSHTSGRSLVLRGHRTKY